jgi:hypothetical protein
MNKYTLDRSNADKWYFRPVMPEKPDVLDYNTQWDLANYNLDVAAYNRKVANLPASIELSPEAVEHFRNEPLDKVYEEKDFELHPADIGGFGEFKPVLLAYPIQAEQEDQEEIPQYILEKENGFDWHRYLHIIGGTGPNPSRPNNPFGGEYDYCVFYASADEMEGLDKCPMRWCKEKKIPFGLGSTIKEAYSNWKQSFTITSKS